MLLLRKKGLKVLYTLGYPFTLKFGQGLRGQRFTYRGGKLPGRFFIKFINLLRFGGNKNIRFYLVKFMTNFNKLWLIIHFNKKLYVVLVVK